MSKLPLEVKVCEVGGAVCYGITDGKKWYRSAYPAKQAAEYVLYLFSHTMLAPEAFCRFHIACRKPKEVITGDFTPKTGLRTYQVWKDRVVIGEVQAESFAEAASKADGLWVTLKL